MRERSRSHGLLPIASPKHIERASRFHLLILGRAQGFFQTTGSFAASLEILVALEDLKHIRD
jgi:hypothetical protein